jgi:3-oxoacyl-[acyl-carrier-protein] synthase III
MAPDFPYSARAAAIACHWEDGPTGLLGFRWDASSEDGDLLRTRVRFEGGRNLLRVEQDPEFGSLAAAYASKTAKSLLADHEIKPEDVDLVVANPLTPAFLEGLSEHMGIGAERFVAVAGAEHVHTAALLVALSTAEEEGRLGEAHRILLVSAGAGIVVGAGILVR